MHTLIRLFPVVILVLSSCSVDRLPPEYRDIPVPEGLLSSNNAIENGAALYQANCAWCHGDAVQGRGARTDLSPPPADLANKISWDQPTPRWVFYVIREGKSHSAMLGLKDKLSIDDTWDIVAFVHSLSSQDDR